MVCTFFKSATYYMLRLIGVSRRRGIEARRKFVAPVGAWFSQIGRLHQVHHMWQYPLVTDQRWVGDHSHSCIRSLEARKETREKAWQIDGWAETVSKVAYSLRVGTKRLTTL